MSKESASSDDGTANANIDTKWGLPRYANSPSFGGFDLNQNVRSENPEVQPPPCDCNQCCRTTKRQSNCWDKKGFRSPHFRWKQEAPTYYFFTITELANAQTAIDIVTRHTIKIHRALSQAYADCGNAVFRQRFKSQRFRRETIENACPEMFSSKWAMSVHWPWTKGFDEFWEMVKSKDLDYQEGECPKFVPWLNRESLARDPHRLVALLRFRTAFSLHHWIPFDFHQMEMGWRIGRFPFVYSPYCVRVTESGFGLVISWSQAPAHALEMIGFPRAYALMQTQNYILRVLWNIFQQALNQVLPEILELRPGRGNWHKQVTKGLRVTGSSIYVSSVGHEAFLSPKRSLRSLVQDVCAQVEEVECHLYSLQCNPTYMRRHWRTIVASLETPSDGNKTDCLGQDLIYTIMSFSYWRNLLTQLRAASSLETSASDGLSSPDDLASSPTWIKTINKLSELSQSLMASCSARSRGNSRLWSNHARGGRCNCTTPCHRPSFDPDTFDKDPALWCATEIMRNYRWGLSYDYSKLFALYEEFAHRTEDGSGPGLNQYGHQRLAEFALAYQVFETVEQIRPSVIEILDPSATREPSAWLKNHNLSRLRKYLGVSDDELLAAEKYSKTVDNLKILVTERFRNFLAGWCRRFEAQTPPLRTQQPRKWLSCREKDYVLLAELWMQVRIHFQHDKTGFWCGVDCPHEAWGFIYHDQTAEHKESVQRERDAVLSTIEASEMQPRHHHFLQKGSNQGEKTALPKKRKTKTRGQGATAPDDVHDITDALELFELGHTPSKSHGRKLKVSKRALEFIACLYPHTAEESGRSINWNLFVNAMGDLGFDAANCGGSAIAFTLREDSNDNEEGKRINIHRPHGPVVNPFELLMFAKRLAKRFGWSREVFELEGASD